MASKIKVDQIQTGDGTGTIALQNQLSGMTHASVPTLTNTHMPAGSVLQALNNTGTNTANGGFLLQTTSSNYVGVASMNVEITPRSASSKFIILVNTSHYRGGSASFTIYRGSTNLGGSSHGMVRMTGGQGYWMPVSLTHLDSPNTTSAVTYQLYARSEAGTLYVGGDSDQLNNITVMEIAG
jgi:hypothetical protein